jgi:molybdopterin-guanine dinucleotide biosynthesis protein A
MRRADTLGAVLAGGLARRMGGGDKPLRLLAGRSLLRHVLDRVSPQVAAVVLNANGDPRRFAEYGLPVVPDGVPDNPGPLAGVLAALDWAAEHRSDLLWVLTAPGDCPFLPFDLAERLHAAREAADRASPLACAATEGRTHPPIGIWPVALRSALREALGAGERKIDRWTARFGCAVAAWPAGPFDPFFNANAPADLDAAADALLRSPNGAPIRNEEQSGQGAPSP